MPTEFNITIDGVEYKNILSGEIPQDKDSSYVKSMVLSSSMHRENGFTLMPAGVEHGANIKKDDSNIEWVPFSYLFWARNGEKNIYDEIAKGAIVKSDTIPTEYRRKGCWKYIQDHFDEYVAINKKNGLMKDEPKLIEEPKPAQTTPVGEIPPSLPLAAAATMAPVINPNVPPQPAQHIPSRPPMDNPMRSGNGYDRTLDGGYRMDMSKVVQVDAGSSVDLGAIINPEVVPSQSPTYVDIPSPAQIATEEPKIVDVQPPKTQKSKKDLKEGAVKPTIVDPPQTTEIDLTQQLISQYPELQYVKDWITDEFRVEMKSVNGLVDVSVFNKDSNVERIDMGMLIDITGNIVSPGAKFWPKVYVDDGEPVDFKRALKLTETAVLAHLTNEPDSITEEMYNYTQEVADLNSVFNIQSIWKCGVTAEDSKEVFGRIREELGKITEKLNGRRVIMTKYTDKDHFTLETPENAPQYLCGPTSNPNKEVLVLNVNGKNVKISTRSKK